MHNAVTAYRPVMPSALSTTHVHTPFHQVAAAEVASCDHGLTSRPTLDVASCTDSYQQ